MATKVNISQYLEKILTAVYGEEVREAIHHSISLLHDEVERDITVVTDTFDATTAAGTAADAKAINDQAILIRGMLINGSGEGVIDFDTILTSGVYRLSKKQTYDHSPLSTDTGCLLVYKFSGGGRDCLQIVYETGITNARTYSSYFRTHSDSGNWSEWQSGSYSLDTTLTKEGYAADAKAVGDKFIELGYAPMEITDLYIAVYDNETGGSHPIGEPVEVGQTVVRLDYQVKMNKEPSKVTLDGTTIAVDTEDPTECWGVRTNLNIKANKTWTFKATEPRTLSKPVVTASRAASVIFLPRVFWGTAVNQTNPDSTFVESFRNTGSILSDSINDLTFTVTADAGKYIWFAYPASYGLARFTQGGFTGGFKFIKQMTFTSKYNITNQYYIYRSVQPSLGNVTITVHNA